MGHCMALEGYARPMGARQSLQACLHGDHGGSCTALECVVTGRDQGPKLLPKRYGPATQEVSTSRAVLASYVDHDFSG